MSISKANRLIEVAKSNGWEIKWTLVSETDENVVVVCTRGAERLEIEWQNNQLSYSPKYSFHDMKLKLHSRKTAENKLRMVKPDIDQYRRWQRRSQPSQSTSEGKGESDFSEYMLPFDIKEDTDATILKAIRGNTIIFKNTKTGEVESVLVPWKISGGRQGIRVLNVDLENVYYLAESESGRAYLSFMDIEGRFRAVHLDRLIGVA